MIPAYLLDTDWVIHWLNGNQDIQARLTLLRAQGLAHSVISFAELYEGIYYSSDPIRNERSLLYSLPGVMLVGLDEETCKLFGKYRGRLRSEEKGVGDFDLLFGCNRHPPSVHAPDQ